MLDESYRPIWEESCWRDEEKVRLATGAGIHYLVVREDEPFTNPAYLAGRLVQLGVMEPGQVPLPPGEDHISVFDASSAAPEGETTPGHLRASLPHEGD